MMHPMHLTVVFPVQEHHLTVVFLHGRGSNGDEFCGEMLDAHGSTEATLPAMLPWVKWIFPTAPERFLEALEMTITDWFEPVPVETSTSFASGDDVQIHGLDQSIHHIQQLLREEIEIVGASRVVIGGISQGCGTALHSLLSFGKPLAGFIGLCGWAPFNSNLQEIANRRDRRSIQKALDDFYRSSIHLTSNVICASKALDETPAFIAYSLDDDVVLAEWSCELLTTIRNLGMSVEVKEYDDECGHWIQEPEGIDDIRFFLAKTLKS